MSSHLLSSNVEAQLQTALAMARSNRLSDAIGTLRGALAQQPQHIALRVLLGVMLQQSGDNAGALQELDAAAALAPDDVSVHETRASVLLALQRYAEAESAARAGLALDPQRTRVMSTLALALDAQQRSAQAAEVLQASLARRPGQPLARGLLARCLLHSGDSAAALTAALHPDLVADAALAEPIAAEFCTHAPHAQSLALLDALLVRHPRHYLFVLFMARILHQAGRSSEALQWSEHAHALDPHAVEPIEMRAVSLLDRGEIEQGLPIYRDLLARSDASAETASRYLILAHYDPAQDNEALFAAHTQWTRRFIHSFGPPFKDTRDRDAQRPLRIGWISPRFDEGPVMSFFTGLLSAFDRERFVHCLVSLRRARDAASTGLRTLAAEWHDLHGRDDRTLLRDLRAAEFDIVIDLAGHSFGNRLPVLAQRVAPIQLCWLDYFNTTAVAAMDGWISDAWLTPPDSPQRYTERVLRLDVGRFCYTPPGAAQEADRIGGGAPVFASFNRLAKVNDEVLDVWVQILHRVPAAQLELGAHLLDDAVARTRTLQRFAQRGIDVQRLRLHGQRSYAQLLAAYRRVDIALDPFPFSGCTTSCDALWMGVPVVTLCGATFVARQSASLLERLGRTQWIAADVAGYVESAVSIAARLDAVRGERNALRELTRARLCDAAAQARDFAALLRGLWHEHCATAP